MSPEIDFTLAKYYDPRPTQELIRLALTVQDDHEEWGHVAALTHRGNREVLEETRALCYSENPSERRLGTRILAQLGAPTRPFPAESFEVLAEMLETESEPEILSKP